MKINGMDFLNSFRGCQVIDYRMTKRFKGQIEGKNRYLYGILLVEIIIALTLTGLMFKLVHETFTATQPIGVDRYLIMFLVCLALLIGVAAYYKKNMFMVAEYTLRIDDTFSEVDKEKIKQEFYLKRTNYLDKSKNADDLFVAYPRAKGGLE